MIYEFRTYGLVPGGLPEFLALFSEALPERERFSRMAAFWCTDIGPLNEVIHVWPYADAVQRSRLRAEAVKAGIWPPATGHLIRSMRSEIFEAAPGTSPLVDGARHACVELTTQILKPFSLARVSRRWADYAAEATPPALKGVFASDIGELNVSMQVWGYAAFAQRAAVRDELAPFPPRLFDDAIIAESSKLLVPAPFSPV